MHEAYTARADAQDGSAETSQTDMGLKPGETITLKLAKVSCVFLLRSKCVCVKLGELILSNF